MTDAVDNQNGALDQSKEVNSANNCFQSLRLAVAIAVIRTKPPAETGVEYAKKLYSLINGRCKENEKENERLDFLINSLSISVKEGLSCGDGFVKKENKLKNAVMSNGQMQLVMSVASLNKFSKTLTDKLDSPYSNNCESISFALISDNFNNVFEATKEYLAHNKSGVAAKAGLKQIAEIASKLELLCLQNCHEPVYKALLNCILNKTSELMGNSQQFIVESTLVKDYSRIPDHLQALSILSQSASLFVATTKLLVGCITTVANQFSSNIFSPSDCDVTSSHLSVCLFTNVGYLLQVLSDSVSSMTAAVSGMEQDLQKRKENMSSETAAAHDEKKNKPGAHNKRRMKRKKLDSKKESENGLVNKINNTMDGKIYPSMQFALVIHGDGDYLTSIVESLKCVSSLIERAPLFAMFVMKCQFQVEKLNSVVSDIIKEL